MQDKLRTSENASVDLAKVLEEARTQREELEHKVCSNHIVYLVK